MNLNFLLLAYLLALLASGSQAALYRGVYKHADHPGKCYIDEKTILDEGEEITQEGCTRAACGPDSMVTFATCIAKEVNSDCTVGEKKYPTAEYPKCCINILHCPDGDIQL